jgi:hypothetical protein
VGFRGWGGDRLTISLLIPCSLEAETSCGIGEAAWDVAFRVEDALAPARQTRLFPVFFAVNRELLTETGWLETGYTAIFTKKMG